MERSKFCKNIDEYINGFPNEIKTLLGQVRKAIKQAAPDAAEAIKYGIPTFVLGGNLVHFASCKNHIGFYPAPSAIMAFKKELSAYKCAKGSVQFPFNETLPLDLITQMVEFRVEENMNKALRKKS